MSGKNYCRSILKFSSLDSNVKLAFTTSEPGSCESCCKLTKLTIVAFSVDSAPTIAQHNFFRMQSNQQLHFWCSQLFMILLSLKITNLLREKLYIVISNFSWCRRLSMIFKFKYAPTYWYCVVSTFRGAPWLLNIIFPQSEREQSIIQKNYQLL